MVTDEGFSNVCAGAGRGSKTDRSCSHAIDVEIVGNEAGVAGVEGHDEGVGGGIHDGDEE